MISFGGNKHSVCFFLSLFLSLSLCNNVVFAFQVYSMYNWVGQQWPRDVQQVGGSNTVAWEIRPPPAESRPQTPTRGSSAQPWKCII